MGVITTLNRFSSRSYPYHHWSINRKKNKMSEYVFWDEMWNVPPKSDQPETKPENNENNS